MIAVDMLGNAVVPGDLVCDARGLAYTVGETEATILREGAVRTTPQRGRTAEHRYLRLAHVLRLNERSARLYPKERAALWRRMWETHLRPAHAEALRERKTRVSTPAMLAAQKEEAE